MNGGVALEGAALEGAALAGAALAVVFPDALAASKLIASKAANLELLERCIETVYGEKRRVRLVLQKELSQAALSQAALSRVAANAEITAAKPIENTNTDAFARLEALSETYPEIELL
jgi:hypothetical protein